MLKKVSVAILTRKTNFLKTINQFSTNQPHVLTKEIGDKALIILNRPKNLNAMSDKSLEELIISLRNLENKKSLVILKSACEKAFSVGGDLIKLAAAGEKNDTKYLEDVVMFLNVNIYLIYKYKIPIVALMDGYTMGGGMGICAFAPFRIATERTIFAMPEVKLGFHPNAAATHFFNRTKNKLGYYLALTGSNLRGSDVLKAGFATHYCHSKNLKRLEESILNCSDTDHIKSIIDGICEKTVPELSLNPVFNNIENCFSGPTVEKIISRLKDDGSSLARETLNTLNKYSPTSLKVILKQLQIGRNMNLADILIMESNITVNFYSFPDVIEGTRIVLKDKSDTPIWKPPKLEDVTEEIINSHFKPVGEAKQKRLLAELTNWKE
ncbi:unnamed protein product [Psylliodes chrysocephalus]|uniref:3-hydroxyisobutyryl-CoA hydrolase, mitochondrial n=1 Tax=Psylliodes chrysocephalus TaxID=3402493 RepID=A0A9P0CYV3_9CUCU|nr:unnamed protein product [Psylliodes chrysocephala]